MTDTKSKYLDDGMSYEFAVKEAIRDTVKKLGFS